MSNNNIHHHHHRHKRKFSNYEEGNGNGDEVNQRSNGQDGYQQQRSTNNNNNGAFLSSLASDSSFDSHLHHPRQFDHHQPQQQHRTYQSNNNNGGRGEGNGTDMHYNNSLDNTHNNNSRHYSRYMDDSRPYHYTESADDANGGGRDYQHHSKRRRVDGDANGSYHHSSRTTRHDPRPSYYQNDHHRHHHHNQQHHHHPYSNNTQFHHPSGRHNYHDDRDKRYRGRASARQHYHFRDYSSRRYSGSRSDDSDRGGRHYSSSSSHASGGSHYNEYDDKNGHYNFELDKILAFIGEGTFAKVVECWDREQRVRVAVKIVRSILKYTDAAEIEIDILKDIGGKRGCIELSDSFMFKNHMCLVFPKYGSSLFDFIKSNKYRGFYLSHVRSFARHLLTAIDYLHREKKLVHTDLKPENILMVNSEYFMGDNRLKVPKCTDLRVIDFGSATYEDQHHTTIISTRHYRAPEVILDIGWSYSADIWSIGCILVELYTGEAMFQTHENREHLAMMERILGRIPQSMAKRTRASKYFTSDGRLNWPQISSSRSSEDFVADLQPLEQLCCRGKSPDNDKFYDMVRKLLRYEPDERLTASQALAHDFFK